MSNPAPIAASTSHPKTEAQGRPLTAWLMGVLFLIGFGPLLFQFFANLWRYEIHQFFPLALLGAGVLAWRGASEVERPLVGGSLWLTLPMTVLFLGLLALATLLWSPWVGVASVLVALIAVSWWLGGRPFVRALCPAWIMLLTVIPPPLKLDARLALELQHWAVAGSSRVLALLAVPHLRSGNILEIPGQRLLVEEACSGINSVLFMTAACVFYVMWQRRSLFFLLVLYVLTIGCVLTGNLIRITSGAWLLFNFQVDLFTGWRHETLGLVLTATYLAFIVAADALLGRLTSKQDKQEEAGAFAVGTGKGPLDQGSLLAGHSLRGGLLVVTVILTVLGVLQLGQAWLNSARRIHDIRVNPASMDGSAKFSLPPELEGWKLRSEGKPVPKKTAFEDGVFSHMWQYEKGGLLATISLDYPFFDYHDVRICYVGSGWTVEESKLQRAVDSLDKIPGMEITLTKENGLKAQLLYSTVDESGNWLEETGERAAYDEQGRALEGGLLKRLTYRLSQHQSLSSKTTLNYRIQLLAASQGGLDAQQARQVAKLFQQARQLLADQFVIRPKEVKRDPKEVNLLPDSESGQGNSARAPLPAMEKSGFDKSSIK